jgi:hypothetical protein
MRPGIPSNPWQRGGPARNLPRPSRIPLALLPALGILALLSPGCPTRSPTARGSHAPPPPPGTSIEFGAFRPLVTGPSGRLYLTFQDALSPTFRLVRIRFALDDAHVLLCGDGERSLDATEPILVYDGTFAAGNHALDVELSYRGVGHGVFAYLEGYTFRVHSSHDFDLPAAAFVALHARAFEHGDVATPLEERPQIAFEDRSTDPPAATPRPGCPWEEGPAPGDER